MTDDPQFPPPPKDSPTKVQPAEGAPPADLYNRVTDDAAAAAAQQEPKPVIGRYGATNLGAIQELSAPHDWMPGAKVENAQGFAYSYQWNPVGHNEVSLCVSSRSAPASAADAKLFSDILAKGDGYKLTPEEIVSLRGTLADKADPKAFTVSNAVVRYVDGHNVLAINGDYTGATPRRSEAVFIPAKADGSVVQEVAYTAPVASFPRFGSAAGKSLDALNLK